MQRFKLFGLFIIIISLVSFSCNNYFNDNNNTNNKSTGSLTITVSLDTNLYTNFSRTAIPNNIDIENFYNNFSLSADAVNILSEDEIIEGNKIEGENNSFHFELKPSDWEIIVYAKYIGPDTETYKDIVFKGKKNITIESNGKFDIDIPITYIKENSGNVNLKINIDEDTKINCVIISNENIFNGEYNINNNYVMINKENIPSGNYYLQLDFCHKSNDEITKIISLHEAINIYDNVLTNTWKKTSLTPYIDDNGNFNLTKEIVTKILNTQFYVNGNSSQNINNGLPTGSWKNPFHTINDAINKINIINDNSTIYDIFVSGTITEEVPLKILSNTKIRILKDSSITETDEAILQPSDSFTENRIIENNGSLTLSGIKINGKNTGGIKTLPSSKLTLNNVTIENCKSEDNGSGIFVASDATLNIGGFIKIAGNKTKVGTEEKENNVYLPDEAKLSFISGLSEGSEIGITTQTTPLHWNPVEIASKLSFDTVMPDKNINSYVKSDIVGYGIKGESDSYSLVPSGGEISVVFAGFDFLSRTAYPAEPSVLEYKVIATNQEGKNIEGKSNINTNEYSIELPVGTWNLKIDGLDSEGKTILTKTETIEVLSENYYATKNVGIKEISNSGTGDVNLKISIPSKYENANALIELKKESGSIKQIVNVDERTTLNKVGTLDLQNIPAGKYTMTVKLYDENINKDFTTNGILLYTFKDNDVNIYDNLLTNQWDSTNYKNNVLEITDEKIKEQVITNYYVSESGNDSSEGTQELPFASIRRGMECANKIYGYFTDINDFTFNLIGSIVENKPVVISNGLNIEIKKDATTETHSVQKGATFIGDVLIDVETGGTLLINDITIDGGNAATSTNVSGIKVLGTLTLKNVIIQNCESAANGAGVYVSSGATFNVGGLIKITGNKTKVGTEEKENNVYLCDGAKLSFISGLSEGSEIGITTQTTPLYWNPVEIASKSSFDSAMPDKNINSYIKSDIVGFGIKGVADSYSLVPSGGNFEIGEIPNLQILLNEEPSSENIILSESLEVSIIAMLDGKIIDFDSSDLPKITVYNHGSLAQSTISGNTYTIPNDWPKDETYQFVVSCVYEGITYTETFTVYFENELEDE